MICPNNPDASAYLVALFVDLGKNYDVDFVQTCLRPFASGERRGGGRLTSLERVLDTVVGTCYCDSWVAVAKVDGFDLKAAQRAMLAAGPEHPRRRTGGRAFHGTDPRLQYIGDRAARATSRDL